MKTSCFFVHQGPGRISIARFAPRGTPAGYRELRALAPGEWFKTASPARYRALYFKEILGPLDPQRTYDQLHKMAAGAEPVLLCWERPPLTATHWCHRRMVAEWFQTKLGLDVPEYMPAKAQLSLLEGKS